MDIAIKFERDPAKSQKIKRIETLYKEGSDYFIVHWDNINESASEPTKLTKDDAGKWIKGHGVAVYMSNDEYKEAQSLGFY